MPDDLRKDAPQADDDAPSPGKKNVGRRALSGAKWMTGSQIVKQVVNLGVKLLLARLLAPRDFGVVALASTFVTFAETFVSGGFLEAMVQKAELDDRTRSTAFWLHLLLGSSAMAVLLVLAPWLAELFDTPQLTPILRALAAMLFLSGLSPTYQAALTRDLRFRALGLRLMFGTVIGGAAGLAAALAGWGAWALVVMLLTKIAVQTVALFLADPWRPRSEFDGGDARGLWDFARFQLGTKLLNFGQRNLDNLLIGGVLGVASLGIYTLAYQAVLAPLQYITRPVLSVVFAALCNLPTEAARERAYIRTLEVLIGVTWPLSLIGAVALPPVLPLILGDKWVDVVPVFAILAIAPLFQSPKAVVHALAQANGVPRYVLQIQTISAVLVISGFAFGLPFGVVGVAWGYTLASLLLFPLTLAFLPKVGASRGPTARLLVRASVLAAGVCGAGFAVKSALAGAGTLLVAVASGATMAIAWGALSFLALPELWKVARMLVRRRRGRK